MCASCIHPARWALIAVRHVLAGHATLLHAHVCIMYVYTAQTCMHHVCLRITNMCASCMPAHHQHVCIMYVCASSTCVHHVCILHACTSSTRVHHACILHACTSSTCVHHACIMHASCMHALNLLPRQSSRFRRHLSAALTMHNTHSGVALGMHHLAPGPS